MIVQIKYGPIDFQAREPVSPLFAGLEKTNEAMELQITQEYTGQQRHLVYLAPMWKQMLDFDLHAENRSTPVKEIIEGKSFISPLGGMIGVSCVGRDGWLGSPLAMANLYAFGRLAWDPNLSAGADCRRVDAANHRHRPAGGRHRDQNADAVVACVRGLHRPAWHADAHRPNRQPLRAQVLRGASATAGANGIATTRRASAWTAASQPELASPASIRPTIAKMYESSATTPDDLLLFFHHVPYTYKLHSGETVIQYFYDSHYQGADEAARLVRRMGRR